MNNFRQLPFSKFYNAIDYHSCRNGNFMNLAEIVQAQEHQDGDRIVLLYVSSVCEQIHKERHTWKKAWKQAQLPASFHIYYCKHTCTAVKGTGKWS